MRRIFFYLCLLLGTAFSGVVSAQTVVQAALNPGAGYLYNSASAAGSFVFGVKNHNTSDIVITTIGNAVAPNFTGDITLWYNATTVTGAPGPIDASNNWIAVKTVTATNATANTVYVDDLFSGLNITIPAGTVYRMAMSGPPYSPYYVGAGNNTSNSYKVGGVEICTQDNPTSPGYGGAFPSPGNTPRGTAVRISFLPTAACTGTPNGGSAVVTVAGKSQTWVCGGNTFDLDLSGNSIGTGQTYRWQSSTDNSTWTTYISAASPSSNFTASQTEAVLYYRAELTCGGNVSYSASVMVTRINSLSGTYTINPINPTAGTNFQSFDDVAGALGCGISGPVVFNVEPGSVFTLTNSLTIPFITGVSATNTVTFNGNGATLSYNTSTSAARTALILSGAKHVIIDSFNIDVTAGSYGFGIQLTNLADSNIIRRNTITTVKSSTSSNYAGIVLSGSATSATGTGDNGNGNLIDHNKIIGGYYGITNIGASATPGVGNIISNNILEDYYYYGIYTSYQNGLLIKSNDISRPSRANHGSSATSSGIYLTTGNVGVTIDGNKIHHLFSGDLASTSIASGIYFTTDATMAEPNKVINNLIYNIEGNGTFHGIYNSGAAYMQAYHNTIALDYTAATAGTTYGFYQTTSDVGIEFQNNIVYITRGGSGVKYCIYKSTAATPIVSNYNVLYVNSAGSGAQNIGYQTSAQTTLDAWRTASGQDLNSVSLDPLFTTPGVDYTPTETSINNLGTNVGVATDITGAARSVSPDPGAYEFDVVGSDAAITWVSPTLPAPMGSTPIKVKISNVATSTITSVNLSYTDGINQVNQVFSGLNVVATKDTTLEFTTPYNITGNVNLRAFINLVNGSPDLSQLNDTTDVQSVCFALNGTYTINSTAPTTGTNFASFADAAAALSCGGVSGPVVINVVTGTGPYVNDRLLLPEIAGASATNTITINGNGETLIYSSADATARAAVMLNGTDHVIIDSLNIDGESGGGAYCWGILFTNKADSNIVRKCDIKVSSTSTSLLYHAAIVMSGSATAQSTSGNNANYNTITQNTLSGGYDNMYLYGLSTAGSQNTGNIVTNNTVKDFYRYGIYEYGQAQSMISGNDISRPARATVSTGYGVYLSTGVTSTTVSNNRIHNMFDGVSTSTSGFYGIYLAGDATAGNEVNVYNNIVYNITIASGLQYGIYNSGQSYTNIYHNSITFDDVSTSTSNVTRGFYQTTAATNINFKNNIISITRSGTGINTAIYLNTATSVIASDNNSLYVAGSGTNYIGYYNSTTYANISDWKLANSGAYDQASVSANPMFTSAFTGDLIPTDAAINNLGVPVGITTDITGAPRSVSTPDPGAFEFDVAGIDASMAWVSPTSPGTPGLNTITVAVTNTSTAGNITSLKLGYTDGTAPVTQTFTGLTLAPGATQNFMFTTQYNLVRQATLQAYVELANGSPDISAANDTAIQVLCVPLSGTYTIDVNQLPSVTNFSSFSEAVAALSCTGVSGPVIFDVAIGTVYALPEQLVIPSVMGASTTNTITFKGNGAMLNYNTSTSALRSAIVLNGAKHIIIDSLMIDVTGGTHGWGIQLTGKADSNIIRKNTIVTSTSSTSTNYSGIVLSGSTTSATTTGDNGNGNLIDSNRVVGGYYGIVTTGASATPGDRNIVSNNMVEDYAYYGIYSTYQTGLKIKSNNISRPTRASIPNLSSYAAIYLTTGNIGLMVDGNKIHNLFAGDVTSTSANSAIYVATDGTLADPNRIINNLVFNIEGNGSFYGIYNSGGAYMQAYHNTISLDYTAATAGATYGFYQTTSDVGIEFRNNIVSITRGGSGAKYCIYKSTSTTPLISNNNVLYIVPSASSPVQAVGYQTSARTTLADWQAASSQDANSLNVDPLYTAPGFDYTPQEITVDDLGAAVGVVTDINNVTRSLTSPDPGAFEIPAVAGIDIRPEVLVSPALAENNCYSSETITVKVKNNSQNPIDFTVNPLTVLVEVTGPTTGTFNTVVNTGSMTAGSLQDIVITIPGGSIDMTATGTYTFKIVTTVTGDVNNGNDTATITRTREPLSAGTIKASPAAYCLTGGTPALSATDLAGYGSLIWQQSTTSGTGFTDIAGATTNPYTVGSAITQTMYYRLAATCGGSTIYSSEQLVQLSSPQITTTSSSYTCGPGTVTIGATGTGSNIYWYANSTDRVPLDSGNTFTTPVLNSSTTYYASAGFGSTTAYVGKTAPVASPTSGAGTTNFGLMFDALTDFTLHTVTVYPVHATAGTPGSIVIDVIDGTSGTILHTATVNVTGYPTTALVGQQVVLDFNIAAGTNYKIRPRSYSGISGIAFDPSASAPGGDYGYPFVLPGIVSINTSTLTAVPTNTARNDLYYYFYNWEVTVGCESPRMAVTATVNNDPTCVPLPVTMFSFNGVKEAQVHILKWQTATEVNNNGFELERSADGIHFEKIAFVASKANRGNSSSRLDYIYRDNKPMMGSNYYRLKQIDINGKVTYSGIVLLQQNGKGLFVRTMYPNPATRDLKVQLETSSADKVTLQVTDLSGKVLMQVSEQLQSGVTTIPMNVSGLAAGSYFLKVICSSGCETPVSKFVKL